MQTDSLNALISNTVLVHVTGTTRGATTEVLIDPQAEPRSELGRVSYAVCNNLLTLDQALISRKLGALSAAAMRQIEDGIRTALGLP
jgi:mRNA-degrading endonuclease toxin of MazEF toxin-antitoxin module